MIPAGSTSSPLTDGIKINLDNVLGFGGEGGVVGHKMGKGRFKKLKQFKKLKAIKFVKHGRSETDEISNITKVSHRNLIKLDSWAVLFNKRNVPFDAYG